MYNATYGLYGIGTVARLAVSCDWTVMGYTGQKTGKCKIECAHLSGYFFNIFI